MPKPSIRFSSGLQTSTPHRCDFAACPYEARRQNDRRERDARPSPRHQKRWRPLLRDLRNLVCSNRCVLARLARCRSDFDCAADGLLSGQIRSLDLNTLPHCPPRFRSVPAHLKFQSFHAGSSLTEIPAQAGGGALCLGLYLQAMIYKNLA